MTSSNLMPDEETLAAAAWVCYVQSLDGHTCLQVTDTPKWSSDFHREKYLRRAREVFEAVAAHQERVREAEEAENSERLITSADINNATAAKANELWGGGK